MRALLIATLLLPGAAAAQPSSPLADTPVLARTVEKGERVTAGDFTVDRRPASVARVALKPADADGMEAARRLMAGAPLRASDLVHAQLVRRGESVVITVRAGTLSISTPGKALTGGGAGEAVRVLSISTNRTLDAVVESGGHVRVTTL
ncbi:flagellar basal body P-ring formation chaperone FlgA [Sphingomonas quercus]|uniref:Flagella basal body P-ring formation protein FlgA n=1 Tax=Sphingomonas quercus TaxID=2842451 RepID=A0ABS6BK40_9SPHN|nr:flagellar basal body P-ring formation chaperone FlgA [Sphingomonas quercus]MBU3078662.1 flagellar basal body P-ring formation chaperone FlgA [Sphingomonas quercus]